MAVRSYQIILDKPARWYAELIDNLPMGIFRTALEGELIFCNKSHAKIFGADSVSSFIGYPVVNLYRDKKNRGDLIKALTVNGYVEEVCIPFITLNENPIWCAMTANAVFDDDGIMVFIDGIIRDVTGEIEGREGLTTPYKMLEILNGFMVILNIEGELIDVNENETNFLGYTRDEILGKDFSELTHDKDKDFFQPLLSNVLKTGREEVYISLIDKGGKEHPIEFHASLIRKLEKPDHIRGIARFITESATGHREITAEGKLEGVLEMAGGVAHKLNQPLTIINNLLNEVLAESSPGDKNHEKIVKIYEQLEKLNEIAKKIRGVKKYESMDYVGGIKIVDIDKSS